MTAYVAGVPDINNAQAVTWTGTITASGVPIVFTGSGAPSGTQVGIGNDGSDNLVINVKAGKVFYFKVNAVQKAEIDSSGNLLLVGTVTTYNNVSTAGVGLATILASGTLTGNVSNTATIATYTPTATGLFRVNWALRCTAFTGGTVFVNLSYKDDSGQARNLQLYGVITSSNAHADQIAATGNFLGDSVTINASANAITLQTSMDAANTNTVNYWGSIEAVGGTV